MGHTVGFLLAALVLGVQLARQAQVSVWSNRLLAPVGFAVVGGVLGSAALAAWSPDGRVADLAAVVVLGGAMAGGCLLAARQAGLLGPQPDQPAGGAGMTGSIVARRAAWWSVVLSTLLVLVSSPAQAGAPTGSEPSTPVTEEPAERTAVGRVLVFSLPAVRWGDLDEVVLPHLEPFLDEAAIGDLSVRGVGERTAPTDGYATIGAGTRARGGTTGQLAFIGDEQQGGQSTRDEFARRTGVTPNLDEIFALNIVDVTEANERLDYGAEIGALGDALAAGGYRPALVANADRWVGDRLERHAPSALAMVDGDGLVPGGTVGLELLDERIDAPGSVVLDRAAVLEQLRPGLAGPLGGDGRGRVTWPAGTPRRRACRPRSATWPGSTPWPPATCSSASCSPGSTPTTDAVLIVGPYDQRLREHVTIAALQAPGIEPGLLRSSTTRRSGFVTLADVGPTVLDLVGIERPSAMEGRPFEVGTEGGDAAERRAFLVESDQDATLPGRPRRARVDRLRHRPRGALAPGRRHAAVGPAPGEEHGGGAGAVRHHLPARHPPGDVVALRGLGRRLLVGLRGQRQPQPGPHLLVRSVAAR